MLVARVFMAQEMQLPLKLQKSEVESRLQKEYKELLKIEGGYLPDPMCDLEKGWLAEKEGKGYWPQTLIGDIGAHLGQKNAKVDLLDRIMNEYKEQKAYSYVESQYVYEVLYHEIGPSSSYCFLIKFKLFETQNHNINNCS